MTKAEVAGIMVKAKDSFQKWRDIEKAEFAQMIVTWSEYLSDVPYETAKIAMDEYIKHNQYPPTIADIRKPHYDYLEKQKQTRIDYNNIYFSAIAHYPCYEDDAETRNLFNTASKKSVSKARALGNKLIEYVRENERTGNIDNIPTLKEWLKGEIESG